MSAYGNIQCDLCKQSYYELDEHTCDIYGLRNRIEHLEDDIERLKETLRVADGFLQMGLYQSAKRLVHDNLVKLP